MRQLQPHPTHPPLPFAVEADASRTGDRLRLAWRLSGDLSSVEIAPPGPTRRGDELWRETCFEAFVAPDAREPRAPAYVELNLSPSRAFALYGFDAYRDGMRSLTDAAPEIERDRTSGALVMTAALDLSGVGVSGGVWRIGLTAVVGRAEGRSFWALTHVGDTPDFHRPESFVLRLGA